MPGEGGSTGPTHLEGRQGGQRRKVLECEAELQGADPTGLRGPGRTLHSVLSRRGSEHSGDSTGRVLTGPPVPCRGCLPRGRRARRAVGRSRRRAGLEATQPVRSRGVRSSGCGMFCQQNSSVYRAVGRGLRARAWA